MPVSRCAFKPGLYYSFYSCLVLVYMPLDHTYTAFVGAQERGRLTPMHTLIRLQAQLRSPNFQLPGGTAAMDSSKTYPEDPGRNDL